MIRPLPLLIFFILLSNCSNDTSEQDAIMRLIESKIILPEDASPIEAYSRNYAILPNKKVLATYIIPSEPIDYSDKDVGCDIALVNGGTRPCTEEEINDSREQEMQFSSIQGKAGQSRWLDYYGDLPIQDDGGCSYIEITFDPKSNELERAECNGEV